MTDASTFVCFAVLLAFVFDFMNGVHDAANSVATMIATRALQPRHAIFWAAFFNFIAFLFFGLKVANTIGADLIKPEVVTPWLVTVALSGAIGWNGVTWYFGLPSSSSHALIGGLMGAALVASGWDALKWHGLLPVLAALVLSPILGLIASLVLMQFSSRLCRGVAESTVTRAARRVHFIAAAFLSLGHGGNDAQKTMGIVAVLLFSAGFSGDTFHVPFWVIISCNFVMALGTLLGGWRIVQTMGEKITALTPLSGSCAAMSAAITLLSANELGIPVSTTHTVTGAVVGVGSSRGWRNTNWVTVRQILLAWLLTLPAAGLLAAVIMGLKMYWL